jgi:hypothetical protein
VKKQYIWLSNEMKGNESEPREMADLKDK